MRRLAPLCRRIGLTLLAASMLLIAVVPIVQAQSCSPASCTGTFHVVTFESQATGASVEGLGAVDPDLAITSVPWTLGPSCPTGTAKVIETGTSVPYASYSSGATDNACLHGTKGFGDDQNCVLNYDFTFAPGRSISCFSIRILDYGDYFPYGGTSHQVFLTAYDASNHQVDQAILTVVGGETPSGDACVTQTAPGNSVLRVSGSAIRKVTLRYDAFADPNVGYDDIAFCEETPGVLGCSATTCDSLHVVTFESQTTGASVEGLGAVDPALDIISVPWMLGPSCSTGSAKVIETGSSFPYSSYSSGAADNACLDGTKGFGDDQSCVLDYDFTFPTGSSISCFSIRLLDYGDYFPFGGNTHTVSLTAYDALNNQVDQAILTMVGGETSSGDACVLSPGSPGNYVLRVGGNGIRKVSLTYDGFPDPNVGYDDITFCKETSVASVGSSAVPGRVAITEIRPNPLADQTSITFTMSERGVIKAQIFALTGRLVADLSPGVTAPGIHSIAWNGRNADGTRARPGIYLIRLRAADQSATARAILVY